MTTRPEASQSFLGWRMVGVAFLAQMLASGITLSAFSNFVIPLSESFSVSRGTITLGTTIVIGCLGVLSPFVGRWVDRGHARLLMTGGALLAGSGLVLLSRIESLPWFALVFGGFVCSGAALFGAMPSTTLVANWFVKRRGFALGITYAGATIVSAVAPVIAQYLIDTSGWRTAIFSFGITVLIVGVPSFAFIVVGRPEEVGQLPDGEEPILGPTTLSGVRTVSEIARDPRLWLISLGFGLVLTSPIVILTLLIPYGQGLGLTAQQANMFLVAAMPFSLLGKLILGALVDRAPAKPIISLVVVANILVWLIFYSEPSFALFVVTGAVYGVGIGGAGPVHGVVLGRCFGRINFGTASGLGGVLTIFLLILATLMSSSLQGEHGEGYPTVFLVQMGLLLLGGFVLALVRIPGLEESID
jgi:MFS family permease